MNMPPMLIPIRPNSPVYRAGPNLSMEPFGIYNTDAIAPAVKPVVAISAPGTASIHVKTNGAIMIPYVANIEIE